MGWKLDFSHLGVNIGWGCSRIACWGKYLGFKRTRWQGSWEDYRTWSFL